MPSINRLSQGGSSSQDVFVTSLAKQGTLTQTVNIERNNFNNIILSVGAGRTTAQTHTQYIEIYVKQLGEFVLAERLEVRSSTSVDSDIQMFTGNYKTEDQEIQIKISGPTAYYGYGSVALW